MVEGSSLRKQNERAAEAGEDGAAPVKKRKRTSMAEARLRKEMAELDLPQHATLETTDEWHTMKITIDLSASENSHWFGGKYEFKCVVNEEYPIKPPRIDCMTPVWHPNIDENGAVCLNILKEVTVGGDWRPNLDVNACILGLIFLFIEPNPNDPLNQKAAEDLRNNP